MINAQVTILTKNNLKLDEYPITIREFCPEEVALSILEKSHELVSTHPDLSLYIGNCMKFLQYSNPSEIRFNKKYSDYVITTS